MRNRKLPVAVLACIMALSLISCGTQNTTAPAQVKEQVTESVTETEAEEEKTEALEESKEEPAEEKKEESIGVIMVDVTKREIPESEALDFVKALGAGWNLGNTFDANDGEKNSADTHHETSWQSAKTDAQMFLDIKEAGFNTVRIPVSWHNHVDENFNIQKVWLDRVQEVVDFALAADLYVIINIHHDNEKDYMYPDYEHLDNSTKYVSSIWTQVASRFGDYDEKLIFETLNEPRLKDTSDEWWVDYKSEKGKETIDCVNKLNQAAVDAIRKAEGTGNKSRYILVPGYCASPDFERIDTFVLPDDSMAEKENLILISTHAYRPYDFALNQNASEATDKFNHIIKDNTTDIDSFVTDMYIHFVKNGIGVVVTEFGAVNRNDNLRDRCDFSAYFTAAVRGSGMSCIWWDNASFSTGERFAIYNRNQHVVSYPDIVENLTYYGNN